MYDLNSAINQAQGHSEGSSREFKAGVEICRMRLSTRNEIYFRILPSFGATNIIEADGVVTVKNRQGWDYFRNITDPKQNYTAWARVLYSYNFVGHGPGGADGRRVTIIAPKSFGGEGQHFDPVEELRREAKKDPMWKYLTEDITAPDKSVLERAALPFLSTDLIFNMIDLSELQKGVQLGIMSKSGMQSLVGEKGLANQRNFSCTEEQARVNPMALWNCGDLTNPQSGPVLRLRQEQGKGKYNSYVVEVAINQQGTGYQTYPIPATVLEKRYLLDDPTSFMPKYTSQEIVTMLAKVLDGVNPQTRESELVLIQRVFGSRFDVPEIPVHAYKGTAAQTAAGGFGIPTTNYAGSFEPPVGGIPGLSQPQYTPPPGSVPGLAQAAYAHPPLSVPGLAQPSYAPQQGGIPGLAQPQYTPPPGSVPVTAHQAVAAHSVPGLNKPASADTPPWVQPAQHPAQVAHIPGAPVALPSDRTFQAMLTQEDND